MFNYYKDTSGFDILILFGDGTNVKMLSCVEDLDNIEIVGDYFRSNQDFQIGWYIE